MATNLFRGDAPPVAQVTTTTITAFDATTTYKVTINGKVVSVLGAASNNLTAAALQAALIASAIPEFLEVTWTVLTNVVTGTAATPGTPFTFTTSVSGGAGTIGAATTTTASSGPNDISTAANWTTGALPTGSDAVVFDGNTNAYFGLTALAAIVPTSITFNPGFTGIVGLPDQNPLGYFEYRQKFLQHVGTLVTNRSQSGRIKLDFGGTASVTVNQYAAGNPASGEKYAVTLKNTGATCTLNLQDGVVGLAPAAGDSVSFATVNMGSLNNPASDAQLFGGSGATVTTLNQNGGQVTLLTNVTTWNMPAFAGVATLQGSATIGTLNINGPGTMHLQTTGTTTALFLGPTSILDATQVPLGRIIINATLQKGATVKDDSGTITWTNPILMGPGCGIEDLNITAGKNRHVQFS